MSYTDQVIARDSRKNLRVGDRLNILWHTKEGNRSGQGKVHNISSSGMLLETNSDFQPFENCNLSLDTFLGADNYIPKDGRVVWFKKKNFVPNRYLCGVEFVETSEDMVTKIDERVQRGLAQLSAERKWQGVFKILVYSIIVGLFWYITWLAGLIYTSLTSSNEILLADSSQQSQLFQQTKQQLAITTAQLEETKKLYEESQLQLQGVTQELEATKVLLAQTEAMLAQARGENSQLVGEMQINEQKLTDTKTQLEATIAALEQKNAQLMAEMEEVKKKLSYLEGEFNGSDEGKALLKLYRSKMKLVKTKLNFLKGEAHKARISAQKEQDRIRAILGNNGFLIKDGAPVIVDIEKYNAVGAAAQNTEQPSENKSSVDVKFVN